MQREVPPKEMALNVKRARLASEVMRLSDVRTSIAARLILTADLEQADRMRAEEIQMRAQMETMLRSYLELRETV